MLCKSGQLLCRVEYFGVKLDGFCFTEAGWVQSYGSRYVRPPIIYADISRPAAMTVKEFEYAQVRLMTAHACSCRHVPWPQPSRPGPSCIQSALCCGCVFWPGFVTKQT